MNLLSVLLTLVAVLLLGLAVLRAYSALTFRRSHYGRRKPPRDAGQGLITAVLFILAGALLIVAWFVVPGESQPPEPSDQTTTTAMTTQAETTTMATVETTAPMAFASEAEKTVYTFAQANGYSLLDYPESLITLLERNPETEEYVLEYPMEHDKEHTIDLSAYKDEPGVPLFLQWDKRWGYIQYGADMAGLTACGPTTLAMAGYHFTRSEDFSPDKIMQYSMDHGYCIAGNGTAWALISEGGRDLGLDVMEIGLDKSLVIDYLSQGYLVICIMGPGHFTTSGHFILLSGTENGMIRVNDCNSRTNSEKLWEFNDFKDEINNLWVVKGTLG